jgi:hypothetical protein
MVDCSLDNTLAVSRQSTSKSASWISWSKSLIHSIIGAYFNISTRNNVSQKENQDI